MLRKSILALILALAAFAPRLRAQAPIRIQTVSATLANNVACTGTEQDFITNQGITGFQNIGQTSHLATAVSTAATFTMEIDGIDNAGNVFRLSNLQVGAPTNAKGGLVVTAAGYMTNIQVAIVCTAGAHFTASYSGSFSPAPPDIGGALLTAIDKLPFQSAAAGSNSSTTFQSPTGNSSGTIIFQFAAAGPANSSASVQCLSNNGTNLNLYTFALATGTGPQLFIVQPATCPFVDLSYTSGGASATTYNLEYVFNPQGSSNSQIQDPCMSPSTSKLSSSINITSATTVQLIAPVAGKAPYVCALGIDAVVTSSSIESFQLIAGTGATCGTGTVTLTGAMQSGASTGTGPVAFAPSGSTLFNVPNGDGVCMVTVQVSGAVMGVQGWISYSQQ